MPDDNQNQWPNPRPAGLPPTPSFRPTAPPPPPPEITVRTMSSDLESIKESGGAGSAPKPFTPPELSREFSRPVAPLMSPAPSQPKITPADFSAPKRPEMPSAPPKETASIMEEEPPKTSVPLKKVISWVGVILTASAVGLLGYFYVYPWLFPQQNLPEQKTPPVTTAPVTPSTGNVPAVTVPIAENQTPANQLPAVRTHNSFLNSSDGSFPEQLANVDLNSIQNAVKQEAGKLLPSGNLTEVILSDAGGQAQTSLAISALLPEISGDTLKNLFEEDFTLALYYDENGAWPAYILKLKAEASQVEAQAALAGLESSANLKNLFAGDPGTANSSGFKTGQVNGALTRYLPYSQKGASLNFAWSKDEFIISASYNGLKKIIGNL